MKDGYIYIYIYIYGFFSFTFYGISKTVAVERLHRIRRSTLWGFSVKESKFYFTEKVGSSWQKRLIHCVWSCPSALHYSICR